MVVEKTWDDAVAMWLIDKAEKRSLKSDESNIRWLNMFLRGIPLLHIDREVVALLRTKKIASGVSKCHR